MARVHTLKIEHLIRHKIHYTDQFKGCAQRYSASQWQREG